MFEEKKNHIERFIIEFDSKSILDKKETANSKELALYDLNKTFSKLYEKDYERKFYLSSIDPGSGKTTLIYKFLNGLDFRKHSPVFSIVIFFNTIEEIEKFRTDADLKDKDFSIFCSDNRLNAWGLGAANRNSAKILLTTQQMFRMHVRDSFEKCAAFHYLGKPRTLRIWDESLLPATPRSIRIYDMVKLYDPLQYGWGPFVETLEAIQTKAREMPEGELIDFPRFKDVPTPDQLKEFPGITDKHRELVSAITSLQGQKLEIRKKYKQGKTLIGLTHPIPDDFAPAVILDGSGRLKATYRIWEKHKRNLIRLLSHAHDYAPLTIHHWDRASGKSKMSEKENRQEIIQHAAKLINQDREQWLIIHHKDDERIKRDDLGTVAKGEEGAERKEDNGPKGYSLENELRDAVDDPERLKFRHWGIHKATNEFRGIKRVMIIGPMQYAESAYTAIYRTASGTEAGSPLDENDIRHLKRSEHQDHLLQAICRSNVRNVDEDGKCGDAVVYIVGPKCTVSKGMLEETFPGCTVNTWEPVTKPLKGNAAKLIDELRKRFSEGITSITKKEIGEAIGIKKNALSNLLNKENVQKHISEEKITIENKLFTKIE